MLPKHLESLSSDQRRGFATQDVACPRHPESQLRALVAKGSVGPLACSPVQRDPEPWPQPLPMEASRHLCSGCPPHTLPWEEGADGGTALVTRRQTCAEPGSVPLLLRETRLNRTHKHVHTCTRVHVYYTRVHTFPVSPVIPAITLHRTGAGITTGFSAALSAPPVCDRPASLCLRDRGVCAGSPSGLWHGGLTWACRLPSICISSLNPQHHSEDLKAHPRFPLCLPPAGLGSRARWDLSLAPRGWPPHSGPRHRSGRGCS